MSAHVYTRDRLLKSAMRIDLHELRKIIIEALLNAYDVLGVKHGASDDEIKTAWKKLAIQNHPDRGGSHGKMVDVNNAKDRLLNKNDLFRLGAMIKGYEDANAPKTPEMMKCDKCGRNVAIKDGKRVGHYTEQGGNIKCEGSFKPPTTGSTRPENAGGAKSRGDYERDFWADFFGRNTRNQAPPGASRGQPPPSREYEWSPSRSRPGYDYNSRTGQYRPSASARPGNAPPPPPAHGQTRAAGATTRRHPKNSYKVYGWRQGRRVVRVGGKLYGTGPGGRVGNAQTRFNANDRAQITRDGERLKVKKPDSDHTQTWDPIDEVRQIVDNMVIDMLVEIARR